MILIRVMGGLGNQLQQYALYEKFKSLGKEAKLDVSWFRDAAQQEKVLARRELELERFCGLRFESCTEEEKRALLGGGGLFQKMLKKAIPSTDKRFLERDMYHPEIFSFTDRYLEGFWACEKYYQNILPLLREKIKFPKSNNILNQKTKEKMKSEHSVSIHIRRGDYLDPENAGMFGGICTEAYYEAAQQFIRERVTDAHFYLFSDDTEYLRTHYAGPEYTIVDWNKGADSFFDMELMSCCSHNICANSTFSFWGARLNPSKEKWMIRPAKHKNSQEIDPSRMHELWEEWVLIDEKGKKI